MPDNNAFLTTVPVRWSDFDQYGHVNNIAYLEYAQEARVAFANASMDGGGGRTGTVVRHMEIDYLRALLPDTRKVLVETEIVAMGNTSFTIRQSVKDEHGHIAAMLTTVMVLFDLEESRALELPQQVRKTLVRFASPELTAGESGEKSDDESTSDDGE
ncbi:thioesterase family protein [uncultured Corynebacterium sp.]|uniref:acyl-CoA thioesterase n=1 Tax=uncultured Corynebacterium sp. TaxID=159447 RepID=UPI0025CDA0EE|nr:thioesterase family protein [uncultured Corynebacterium sp.]